MHASIRAGLACAALLACLMARAAEPSQLLPPIPDRPAEKQLKDTPAPWRDHLMAVRAVQGIADPLARCLAWPARGPQPIPSVRSQSVRELLARLALRDNPPAPGKLPPTKPWDPR